MTERASPRTLIVRPQNIRRAGLHWKGLRHTAQSCYEQNGRDCAQEFPQIVRPEEDRKERNNRSARSGHFCLRCLRLDGRSGISFSATDKTRSAPDHTQIVTEVQSLSMLEKITGSAEVTTGAPGGG